MTAPVLSRLAEANLPTRFGMFRLVVFRWNDENAHPELSREHLALVYGDVAEGIEIPVRIHSECLTSEVFGSLKCDCKEQLEGTQEWIAKNGVGVILYLRQEGRGIGLSNKIRAYALQEQGADTIEANLKLHLPVDARQYDVAAAMLNALSIRSINLLTNNPEKLSAMARLGVPVVKRIPTIVQANPYSADYLRVKRLYLRHDLPFEALAAGDETERVSGNALDSTKERH
jgi:GTP cyclohydrolase II